MSTYKRLAAAAVAGLLAGCVTQPQPQKAPSLGTAAPAEEVAQLDISIPPTGQGLPPGGATARQGATLYAAKCASCHGAQGGGKPADALVGGIGSLATERPVRTVGSYWPYATTLFDYIRRAMPLAKPLSLSNDEVYALSAYILYLNGIVAEDEAMTATTLPLVRMPNRSGFIDAWEQKR